MPSGLFPLRAILITFAGWVHREQQRTIDDLVEENRVLEEQLGRRRLQLTDDQQRRLAARGQQLGRRLLRRVATIVTPDTILRWQRKPIAAKWTFASRGYGRRGVMAGIRALVIRMARESPSWGDSHIQGAVRDLVRRVGRSTVARTLNHDRSWAA